MRILTMIHAVVTGALGALYVVYNAAWLGRPEPPFETPYWLVVGQLLWGLGSFGMIFVYQRAHRSPLLPALFVTFTGVTYSYVWFLGTVAGTVRDEMVPAWWKAGAAIVGLVLLIEATRALRLRQSDGVMESPD